MSEKRSDDFQKTLSGEEFRLREDKLIKQAKERIKSQFTDLIINCLRSLPVRIPEEKCKMLAAVVMDGKKLEINADTDLSVSLEEIYNFYRYFKAIQSYQCLLISAPWSEPIPEVQRRREEMKNFCLKAFPSEHFDVERLHQSTAYREVSSIQQLETFIRDFFRRPDSIRAKNALHAIIVFFGHGLREGFRTGPGPGDIVALDEITCLVKQEFTQALSQEPQQLPAMVEIIFAQCFGYCYNPQVEAPRFKVTALASVFDQATVSFPNDAGESFILELDWYADTMRQQVAYVEAWRNPVVQTPSAPASEETPMEVDTDVGYQSVGIQP